VQAGAIVESQGLEGALVAVLYPDHQILVHAPIHRAGSHHGRPRGRISRGPSNGMGVRKRSTFPIRLVSTPWKPRESGDPTDAPYIQRVVMSHAESPAEPAR
jgi:hypothetical protein